VKEWLKSVLNYRSYLKNKTGYPFFGPPCRSSNGRLMFSFFLFLSFYFPCRETGQQTKTKNGGRTTLTRKKVRLKSVEGFWRKGNIYHIYNRRLDESAAVDQDNRAISYTSTLRVMPIV